MRNLAAGRRPAIASLLLLATIALLVLVNSIGVNNRSHRGHHEPKMAILEGAYAFHFDNLAEMVATSATVVRGTVVGTARGKVIDEDEIAYTRKVLLIQVVKTLAGQPISGQVTVETAGWRQVDGEAETQFRLADEIPVNTRASGIFFLYDFEHVGHYGFIDDQGAFLVNGAEVQDSRRTDSLVRDLEARTVAELEALIEQAKAAISRGEVRAKTYPGRNG
jgi:hypothetical protein